MLSPSVLESLSRFGLGNLRVTPKLGLLTESRHGVGLALLAAVTLPTETASDAYFGDHGLSIAPTLALARRFGAWRTGFNLGYLARQQAKLLDLVVDDEVFARAGVGYDLGDRKLPVSIDLTLSAATAGADFGGQLNVNPLETLLGATYQIEQRVEIFAGAGAGLAHGFGTPDARFMLGVRLIRGAAPAKPVELDRDHDGILDVVDRCPLTPGLAELQGCPARDSDGDGIADHLDKCPTEPEDKDGFEDSD